jgi:hypothetical protein
MRSLDGSGGDLHRVQATDAVALEDGGDPIVVELREWSRVAEDLGVERRAPATSIVMARPSTSRHGGTVGDHLQRASDLSCPPCPSCLRVLR